MGKKAAHPEKIQNCDIIHTFQYPDSHNEPLAFSVEPDSGRGGSDQGAATLHPSVDCQRSAWFQSLLPTHGPFPFQLVIRARDSTTQDSSCWIWGLQLLISEWICSTIWIGNTWKVPTWLRRPYFEKGCPNSFDGVYCTGLIHRYVNIIFIADVPSYISGIPLSPSTNTIIHCWCTITTCLASSCRPPSTIIHTEIN